MMKNSTTIPDTIGGQADEAIQTEVKKAIFKYSCIGGAIALLPIPVVGEISVIVNQVAMYRAINKTAGIRFTDRVVINAVKFVLSQIAGTLGGCCFLMCLAAVGKCVPFVNCFAGILGAPAAGVGTYLCGLTYFWMVERYLMNGGNGQKGRPDEILAQLKTYMPNKYLLSQMKAEAEMSMDGVDYSKSKQQAQACVDEAKRSQGKY